MTNQSEVMHSVACVKHVSEGVNQYTRGVGPFKLKHAHTHTPTPTNTLIAIHSLCVLQVYYCRSLSLAYIEHMMLQSYCVMLESDETPAALRPVLTKLGALYGLWTLSNHMATLYQGQFSAVEYGQRGGSGLLILTALDSVMKRISRH